MVGAAAGTLAATALAHGASASPLAISMSGLGATGGMVTGMGLGMVLEGAGESRGQRIGMVAGLGAGLGLGFATRITRPNPLRRALQARTRVRWHRAPRARGPEMPPCRVAPRDCPSGPSPEPY